MKACKQQLRAGDELIAAAEIGIGHLVTHIGAHHAWLMGELTEDEKKDTYKRTRLAGPADLTAFDGAMTRYSTVSNANQTACRDTQSDGCVKRFEATKDAIVAADQAINHWREHQANMAAHAAGEFGAERAQELWDATIAATAAKVDPWRQWRLDLANAPDCQ